MKRILVIEDNAQVRENICEILVLSGYTSIGAENGKIGIELAKSEDPDLILCDVMMPELDGFGVLKILNKDQNTFDIPFIFLTAKAEKEDFRRGMGLGADDYITKPFDDVELLEAIDIRLKKSERIEKTFDRTPHGLTRFISQAKAQKELIKLSEEREIRSYNKNDNIYSEGGLPRWLYYIHKGKVNIVKTNEFGKELITHVYSEGEFFGHLYLLSSNSYEDTARCAEHTEVRLIGKEDFQLLLYNNRDFAAQFIKMLANEASETEKQLIELAYSSVRRKVANALIMLMDKNGDKEDGSTVIHSSSRDQLAALAGTAKETLIRTLSSFKAEGLIELNDNSIKILLPDKLRSMPQ